MINSAIPFDFTTGVDDYKGIRINVRFKKEKVNTFKFKHIPENANGPFTSKDLNNCFQRVIENLNTYECDSVFFTIKGKLGETTFGNVLRGKTRERTQISPEDVKNNTGIDILRRNFINRETTTPGFFRD